MKNIHIISTDKPSRLHLGNSGLVLCDFKFGKNTINGQNIYITNDEEIKEGDYMFDVSEMTVYECIGQGVSGYKIILTTDQDLDGVQAIDDEFLECFVKNPSCEEVEVEKIELNTDYRSDWKQEFRYKIIIPQEEPKQDLEKEMFELEQELDIPSSMRWHNSKPKQETLEEAAEQYAEGFEYNQPSEHALFVNCFQGFIEGAKWQAERMYSEEDVMNALHSVELKYNKDFTKIYEGMKEWFEQFKKK
jgi:hypothetical protein